jgi:acetoacetate decarboxylase
MFLDDEAPIAGGRELWGFPKKLAKPTFHVETDHLVGTLDYGPVRVATATMGYKHKAVDLDGVRASLAAPNFLLKIIPHVDGTPRICELVAAGARSRLSGAHDLRSDARPRQGCL